MAQAPVQVVLPEALEKFLEERVKEAGYASASEYRGDLVQKDREIAAVDGALLDSIDSGASVVADDDYWREKRAKLEARMKLAARTL